MEKKKMTNKNAIQIALDVISIFEDKSQFPEIDFEQVVDKLANIRDSYDKKVISKKSPNSVENEKFKPMILEFLADGKHATATEIWRGIPELKARDNMSNQRISAILRLMKDEDNTVDKETVKGKTLFFSV